MTLPLSILDLAPVAEEVAAEEAQGHTVSYLAAMDGKVQCQCGLMQVLCPDGAAQADRRQCL